MRKKGTKNKVPFNQCKSYRRKNGSSIEASVEQKKNPFVGLFYRTESKLIEGQKVKGQVGANFMHELMAICEYTERQNCSVELSLFPSLILDLDQ